MDNEQIIEEFLENLAIFSARETENCIICQLPVKVLKQIGRCVYAYPCGCRLWQGKIPEAWKKPPSPMAGEREDEKTMYQSRLFMEG